MRPVRIETSIENVSHDSRVKEALNSISWDFRLLMGIDGDKMSVMCEAITLQNNPIPPPGFSVGGAVVEEVLETWQKGRLRHYLLILTIQDNSISRLFGNGDVGILAGTNLTRGGLVIQFSGRQGSVMRIVEKLRESIIIDKVSLSQGAKGMVDSGPTLHQLKTLKLAYEKGWYDTPKRVSIRDLSEITGISKSALAEQLVKAEGRVVGDFIRESS